MAGKRCEPTGEATARLDMSSLLCPAGRGEGMETGSLPAGVLKQSRD